MAPSNTSIIPFSFESHSIRVTDQNDEPWFILRDLLEAMGTATTVTAAIDSIKQGLGDGFVGDIPILDRLGREQSAQIVSESAATYLLSRSNTEGGRKLNRFIHVEVLPRIRKTGSYAVQPDAATFDLATLAASALRELANRVDQVNALEAAVVRMQPKADFYDHVAGSEGTYDRTDAARILRTGPKRLWNFLREWGVLKLDGAPYQRFFDQGYFRQVPVLVHKGGHSIPYQQTMVTGKGLAWMKALMDSKVMSASTDLAIS